MTMTREQEAQASDFLSYSASRKLKELAQHPVDLTQPSVLTPQRLKSYCSESCGFKLLYGTERVDEPVLKALSELAQESQAIEKMKQMQGGAVVNRIEGYHSENRPALHTATRHFFGQAYLTKEAEEAALKARQEVEKLRSFMTKLEMDRQFEELILIGIGGSDLGPRANYLALQHLQKPNRRVYFISNVDPDDAAAVLKQVNLKKTLVAVVSKSGTTLETATNEDLVREHFIKENLNPNEHFMAVTCPETPMDNKERYLEIFYLWDWIGGRFSSTSMVGGVVLAFAFGFDVYWEFLKGANEMDRASLDPDLKCNLPLLAALLGIWNHNFLNYPTLAIIPYSQALLRYPAHIQQVEMESNGKLIDKEGQFVRFQTGPVIWGEPGTNAQHSFFQLIHQGTATVPVEMIGFKESQYGEDVEFEGTTSQQKLLANLFAQSLALAVGQNRENPNQFFPGNRPTHILLGKKLTPFAVGALLSFFENRVAFEGFIWGINSFDQEGVQLGKVLANKIIKLLAAKKGVEEKAEAYPLGEAYLEHLNSWN